ncbi:hypothetical protein FQR65_LT19988 [Abscondita terminalis]|nr:hypothetical protein FQR65_LT19988 [Abscondita terminalis]
MATGTKRLIHLALQTSKETNLDAHNNENLTVDHPDKPGPEPITEKISRICRICNKENFDDLHESYEPADDSDLDPDFDPNNPDPSTIKKLPQFFNKKDFVFPEISQTNSIQRGHKKNRLIDYKS